MHLILRSCGLATCTFRKSLESMGLPEKLGNDNTEVILFLVMAKNIELDRSFIAETCQQYVVAVQWCMGLYYSILRMICTMTRTYCLS